jgi:hypothetical protein
MIADRLNPDEGRILLILLVAARSQEAGAGDTWRGEQIPHKALRDARRLSHY